MEFKSFFEKTEENERRSRFNARLKYAIALFLVVMMSGSAGAGPQVGGHGLGGNPREGNKDPIIGAGFYFAPTGGAGMGAECACTVPNGFIDGVSTALTYARAGTQYCTMGNTVSGMSNTSMVLCTANQPAIMRGGNGSGPLGLLQEAAATNTTIRSEQLENLAYGTNSLVIAVPTITADQATAPNNTLTADRLVVPAMAATYPTNYSQVFQSGGCPAGTVTFSAYLKGNGTSGTIDVGAAGSAGTCDYVSGSWTRCQFTSGSLATTWGMGNFSSSVIRGAQDVFVWGIQCEAGTAATSYIPTVASTASRSVATQSDFTLSAGRFNTAGSSAISWAGAAFGASGTAGDGICFGTGTNQRAIYTVNDVRAFDSTNIVTGGPLSPSFVSNGGPSRGWTSWGSSVLTVSGVTGVFDNSMNAAGTTINLGFGGGGAPNTVLSRVCLDASLTRCR